MTKHLNRLPVRATALVTGAVIAISGMGASVASAADNAPGTPKPTCLWAGQAYSEGGKRHETVTVDGKAYTRTYRCENGEWKYDGTTAGTTTKPASGAAKKFKLSSQPQAPVRPA